MSELTINTTQNVNINFTAASIGHRLSANILDWIIKGAYVFVIFYVFFYWCGIGKLMNGMDDWSKFAFVLFFFFPVLIYSIVLEAIFEGQTIGKKIMKLKVVKIDGYGANFGDYLMRWIFKLIDNNISMGVVGLISMAVSEKIQRLGDMAAGTAVISLRNNISINSTILMNLGEYYIPTYPQVIKLSDNDIRIIFDTYSVAKIKGDYDTMQKLKAKIEAVTGIKNQSGGASDFIKIILKDYNYYTQNM
jgi:uncharacterized RDD family membrane protein YckC